MANSYTGYSFTVPAPGRAGVLAAKFVEHAVHESLCVARYPVPASGRESWDPTWTDGP